ncbi:MAG: hypothetical protein ACE5JG_07560, partial [Planctomycetota bacterium]
AGEARAFELVRAALRARPGYEAARVLLGERAPPFVLGDARRWLDWHLEVERFGARPVTEGSEIRRRRATWSPEVYGVRSGPIFLLTPVRDFRLVGRCLATGRLACAALRSLFGGPEPAAGREPLTVLLYPNRDEYYAQTLKEGTGRRVHALIGWTAGHYSPADGVSRFYWHADRDAERRTIGTCIHEICHHWMDRRNPRYASAQQRRGPRQPGYWIEEGFASFMEEGVYDVDAGTWELFNPRARSLDVLQAMADHKQRLIPWERLYRLSYDDFTGLDDDADRTVVRRWSLGRSRISDRQLFYDQAAATCHFLFHADGGRYRRRLLDYAVSFRTGRRARLGCRTAFGLSAPELGARAVAFARAVAAGWRPSG